ncbi:PREDICTED: uncharacterized protein LOC107189375 [Dufourea novaeangliae]|uniref:Uncharacterized protein n=1 Tax=Dufourea novaeangliae TaxID=178035 RepID=A0A154PJB3_DUFNO|nr:PREDICTED: uncharacterized protein LOC107189375 [Dufourea novaeangliae]KZC11290.1 hypothetical protein WN55_02382 [Dufourea novaeangliae]
MFRDGQYLEVIKASDNCLATAVVTVQEKTIKLKKRKVSTNKWLNTEDWAALYKILEKAILRNVRKEGLFQDSEKCRGKKSTRQLEITYTFEPSEGAKNVTSLPTIRVNVSPAKKKPEKLETPKASLVKEDVRDRTLGKTQSYTSDSTQRRDNSENFEKTAGNDDTCTKATNDTKNDRTKRCLQLESLESNTLEEYVPDTPTVKKLCTDLKYIPSRKSTLERIQVSSNEYSPLILDNKSTTEVVRYIPNSVDSSKVSYETYVPSGTTVLNLPEEYVPTSKGVKASVEEYQPDFTSKSMKFDNSYVPSSVQSINENNPNKSDRMKKQQVQKSSSRQKEVSKKHVDLFT